MQAIPWTEGLVLGMGVNSFTQGIARDVAVDIHEDKTQDDQGNDDNSEAGASQKVEYFHTQIKSQSEMAKALNISAALAINIGGIRGTGAGDFVNEEKVSRDTMAPNYSNQDAPFKLGERSRLQLLAEMCCTQPSQRQTANGV